ncbi:MAG: MnhB domain-containing protein [Candidatus Omnitrophota bacterium]
MEKNKEAGMSLIVKTVTRLTVGIILIYGIYLVLNGHIGPGGGTAGGIIIALSFIHLMLAYGKEAVIHKINRNKGRIFASVSAIILLLAMCSNFLLPQQAVGNHAYFKIFSGGLAPFYDIFISIIIGSGLFVVFLALVLLIGERKE